MATKLFVIRVQNDTVFASNGSSNTVISEALGRIEVEDKDQTTSIK